MPVKAGAAASRHLSTIKMRSARFGHNRSAQASSRNERKIWHNDAGGLLQVLDLLLTGQYCPKSKSLKAQRPMTGRIRRRSVCRVSHSRPDVGSRRRRQGKLLAMKTNKDTRKKGNSGKLENHRAYVVVKSIMIRYNDQTHFKSLLLKKLPSVSSQAVIASTASQASSDKRSHQWRSSLSSKTGWL